MGEISQKITGNDGRMNLPVLTISANNGWLTQKKRFSSDISGKEKKKYTLLKKGQLSYNHGNSKIAKYGTVFMLSNYEEALVPHVYHSFKLINNNPNFIEQYFHTFKLDQQLRKYISSSARMDGLLNIGYKDFEKINLIIPDITEQNKIAGLINKIEILISLQQRKIELLSQLKLGLSEKIFPSIDLGIPLLRFKGFTKKFRQSALMYLINHEKKGKAKANMQGDQNLYLETNFLNGGTPSYVDSPLDVKKDDIIILWDGSQSGTVYHGFEGALGSTLKAYHPIENGGYLYQYLKKNQSKIYMQYRTPNIPHVIKDFTKKFIIPVPEQREQNNISKLLMQIDLDIKFQKNKLKLLKSIKQFLLQNMFI